ncbi:hypothetical protein DPMN_107922 [Dreissena polymorpha]|uniref:Uncharacterized protein n=1 Tax=Dreissena polymorpha TaxID=45954 RepID=A0A9D4K7L1_DREPO|nr:hypothetical protein DPMN_107922 [Dreissena polymorpha]
MTLPTRPTQDDKKREVKSREAPGVGGSGRDRVQARAGASPLGVGALVRRRGVLRFGNWDEIKPTTTDRRA